MLIKALSKVKAGDIWWWINPLDKSQESFKKTKDACGNRPALVIATNGSSITILPITSAINDTGQMQLVSRNISCSDYYNITKGVHITDSDKLDSFICCIGDAALGTTIQYSNMLNSSPILPQSQKLSTVFTRTPLGRIIEDNGKLMFVFMATLKERRAVELFKVVQNYDDTDKIILTYNDEKYRFNFATVKPFYFTKTTKIVGTLSNDIVSLINGMYIEYMLDKQNELKSKIDLLENRRSIIDEVTRKKLFEHLDDIKSLLLTPVSYEPSGKNLTTYQLAPVALPIPKEEPVKQLDAKNDINEEVIPASKPQTTNDDGFANWFVPMSKSKYLVGICDKQTLIKALKINKGTWVGKMSGKNSTWYTRQNLLYNSIDWELAPDDVKAFKPIIKSAK